MKHEKQVINLSFVIALMLATLSVNTSGSIFSGITERYNPFYSSAEAAQQSSSPLNKESRTNTLVGEGKASFYANQFHGRTTANGETFNINKLTAAHPSLPFGTWVRVTNMRTGKDVVVRINDRGPFVKGRIIDLSIGAAKELGILKTGTAQVKLETIGSSNRRSSAS
ncbi:septal ring lytic transglycosylase RlpA family protein [Chlorobium sp. KB01]|uniref:septal ring lytic transglycosylase RlpA family protein n=1 Tax=Chlorobium sp. KB01 TaxID=1917528 RepID=UPI00097812EA|nr:septal ring lytic transglycosylase RlpA family protein [Chlorobium sp. KB01]